MASIDLMNQLAARFITWIVKPWEILNRALSQPFSMDANTSDLIACAKSLAVSIPHMPKAEMKPGLWAFAQA